MMKPIYTFAATLIVMILIAAPGYAQKNMSLVGQLGYNGTRATDIWGYVDSAGNEYALVGIETGFSIADVSSDPGNPTELFFIPGAVSGWRDVKTWDTYAYVTNETSNGLLIVDLAHLPDSIDYREETYGGQLNSAHNIFIDEQGFAYVVGADVISGAMFLDLNADPYNPSWVGSYNANYVHDCYVRNDTMWSAEINAGILAVVDVSNKSFPNVMATKATPSTFTHNAWLSDDGKTVFTTDEVSDAFVAAYDVSDLNNITELDRFQSSPGENVIPHNTFVFGNFLVTSYYRDGVVITDATRPDNLIEVGNYDTSPSFSGNGFNGCWGVYPYLPSGNIIASDMEEGLYVIAPTYVQGCYLEGLVTDSATGNPLQGVHVEILSASVQEATNLTGDYKAGVADAGSYDIAFSKPGYNTKVINGVVLSNGMLTVQNAELSMQPSFAFAINVVDAATQNPVPEAVAKIANSQFNYEETGNPGGTIGIAAFFAGTYDIIVGKWGYRTKELTAQDIDANNNTITVILEKGYYDDFALDFEWITSSTASAGLWERGEPDGTTYQGSPSNTDFDLADDISDECYVTGNGGGGAGNDDVDDGEVILTSPVFDLSGYQNPFINYHRWFFNDGGFGGPPNDSLVISISNGIDDEVIEVITSANTAMSQWVYQEFRIFDYLAPTANMQFTVRAVDSDPGHLVEAALDRFQVVDSTTAITSVNPTGAEDAFGFNAFPNPASSQLQIAVRASVGTTYDIQLVDIVGHQITVVQQSVGSRTVDVDASGLSDGLYFIQLINGDRRVVKKLVIAR